MTNKAEAWPLTLEQLEEAACQQEVGNKTYQLVVRLTAEEADAMSDRVTTSRVEEDFGVLIIPLQDMQAEVIVYQFESESEEESEA